MYLFSSDKIKCLESIFEFSNFFLLQISYIQMTPNQSLQTNKTAHIIPTSNAKSASVAIAAASVPRATTIISTAPRKRETGK